MAIKRIQFTLVEVIMALIIIVIAIVAITGVFPISMRMHNNAMRQNQATDIVEELMNLAAYKIKVNNTSFSLTESDLRSLVETASLDVRQPEWKELTESVGNTKYYYYDDPGSITSGIFEDGLIRVLRTHTAYRGDETVNVTELDVVVAMWESEDSPTLYFDEYDSTNNLLKFRKGTLKDANDHNPADEDIVRLNVEASWPGSEKYEDRKKIYLVMEVRREP